MKKTISFILTLCMALSLFAGSALAASSDSLSSAQQTVQAIGIITGDESGNLNLSANVTRAQFAKMMIAASTYKDTISSTAKSSPFKDVKYTHWAASYVQAAVTAGWMTGYTDGTFRPDNIVTLKEAVSATLKMLGYTSSDFRGSFPEAQIAKYNALGLNENITKTQDQTLSRQDCMYLFYNLMSTKNKSGASYATTLGYTVNSSGKIDYSSLVLLNTKGPFIVQDSSWATQLPFTSSSATVYKNGSVSTISSISTYDVYYYNTGMRTVWVYRNRVTGVYTAASPSTSGPTSVTVAGKAYSITSSSAAYALSDMGTYRIGNTVTLLLGMNGDVVGVVQASDLSSTKYGIVTATGSKTYTDTSGVTRSSNTVTVACTDGGTYDFDCDNSGYRKGNMVKVSFSDGKTSVGILSSSGISGTVNSTATTFASYSFADDVRILDSTSNGTCLKIYPARLAGLSLSTSNVLYYALDSQGKISDMILSDVTGDMYSYGILTNSNESYDSMSVTSSYEYIVDGISGTAGSASSAFGASTGPVQMEFSGGSLVKLKNLTGVSLTSLNSAYATTSDGQFALGDNAKVYINRYGKYTLTSISEVTSGNYSLRGYYDKSLSSGGRIRLIVASN